MTAHLKPFGAQIQRLIDRHHLTEEETHELFRQVLVNEQPDLHQGAFLAALVAKGETEAEIVGAWRAIREFDTVQASDDWPGPLFENSGTGMDRLKTFNVSSAAAVVAAACGVTMARHGARAITSFCGTVDLLEAVGIDVDCPVPVVEQSIQKAGIGLFNGMSPQVHPGALGRILSQIRFGSTLNLAASLAHPCRPTLGLRGVYAPSLLIPTATVMRSIGYQRGLVVHGKDAATGLGMDEISVCGPTSVVEFWGPGQRAYEIHPEEMGLAVRSFQEIAATGQVETEAARFLRVLAGRGESACADFTCANAGAILYVAGQCDTIRQGVEKSRETLASGRALTQLRQWVEAQNRNPAAGRERLESMLDMAQALG